MTSLNQLIQEADNLPQVPLRASSAHHERLKEMTSYVDDTLSCHPNIHKFIGNNPLQVMYDNHRHHGHFMSTVFKIGSYRLLARTLPWVYRAYHAHNFSYDYFPLELQTWQLIVEKSLNKEDAAPIRRIYEWMINSHSLVIELSEQKDISPIPIDIDWLETKNSFRSAILSSDHKTCLAIASTAVKTSADIEGFYQHILQPVLYEVGMLWEKAEISVAQEHLASAIVTRVMASVNLVARESVISCGKVVVAASPNEYHEIGASMISDILERDGWDVAYLGSNVPAVDLLQYLHEFKPKLLALSVTIAFNIDLTRELITAIRQDEDLKGIMIMVGGRVFNDNEGLWQAVGADGFAANLSDALSLAQTWSGVAK